MTFEEALIEHCSPTLAGVKPASLFRFCPRDSALFARRFLALRQQFAARGLRLVILKGCRRTGSYLLYLYRERDLAAFRRSHLGFVFQDFNLLDTFSLQDNIYLPLVLAGTDYREMQQKLRPIADQLGISGILVKYPYEVSGGQKQRAAVARALITDPQLILADEPTGALDSRSSDALLELFGELNGTGQTILMVTHSVKAASHAGRVLFLRDGQVYHQLYRGGESQEAQFRRISDTLTVLAGGGEPHA